MVSEYLYGSLISMPSNRDHSETLYHQADDLKIMLK